MDELSPVRFEHHREALGIGEAAPRGCPGRRLGRGVRTAEPAGGRRPTSWRSATRCSASRRRDSVLVPWPAAPLRPREARTVRVRVTGEDGSVSDWSDPAVVERGLDAGDWQASLIEPVARRARARRAVPPLVHRGRRRRLGAAVRDRARDLRRRDQRPPGRRRRPGARLDQLPPPAALPGLRRDRPAAGRGERDRLHGRRRLVARPARLRARRAGHLRDLARRCSRSSRSPTPTAAGR